MKIPAFYLRGSKVCRRNTVDAPNPAREVALVGEACGGRDFRQSMATVAHKLEGALQAQMHDIAVWSHADRSGEHARKVERAAAGNFSKRANLDWLVEMGNDIVPEPTEYVLAQLAAHHLFEF